MRAGSTATRLPKPKAADAPGAAAGPEFRRTAEARRRSGGTAWSEGAGNGIPVTRGRNATGDRGEVRHRGAFETRHRRKEGPRVGMFGRGKDLRDGTVLDDLPGVQHGHRGRVSGDEREMMGDEQHRRAVCGRGGAQEPEHGTLGENVERGRRLVRHDERRFLGEGHGEADALRHAARKLAGIGAEQAPGVRKTDFSKAFADRLLPRGAGRAGRHGLAQLGAHRKNRIERGNGVLENIRHAAAAASPPKPARRKGKEVLTAKNRPAADRDAAPGRRRKPRKRGRGEALAATAFADEGVKSALRDAKRHAAHDSRVASRNRQRHDQVFDRKQRRCFHGGKKDRRAPADSRRAADPSRREGLPRYSGRTRVVPLEPTSTFTFWPTVKVSFPSVCVTDITQPSGMVTSSA